MNRKRTSRTLVAVGLVVAILITALLSACGTAGPSPAKSPAASPAASASAPSSPAPSSASPSPKSLSAEQQAYEKVLENWKRVVEAARQEGEATVYAVTELDTLKKYEAFNKVDPKIQIKFVRMTGNVATERFKAEASTKQFVGNGYLGGSPSTRVMADQGLAQTVDDLPVLYEPGVPWVVPPLFDKPRETLSYGFSTYFLIVNTSTVPAGQEPKTWKDLADPKWKDKLSLWDPRTGGIGQTLLATLYGNPQYGPDVARKVVENARLVPDNAEAARMVARGEAAVTVGTYQNFIPVKDAPVKILKTEDGWIVTTTQMIVAKTAPQLNTMKVFANWFLGKEGQRIISEGNSANRGDIDFITKEAQAAGGKFLPNIPYTWDFEMNRSKEYVKIINKWIDDLGK